MAAPFDSSAKFKRYAFPEKLVSTEWVAEHLDDPAVRFEMGLEEEYPIVQLRTFRGDDASCLNLNRIVNPGILGLDPAGLEVAYEHRRLTLALQNFELHLAIITDTAEAQRAMRRRSRKAGLAVVLVGETVTYVVNRNLNFTIDAEEADRLAERYIGVLVDLGEAIVLVGAQKQAPGRVRAIAESE